MEVSRGDWKGSVGSIVRWRVSGEAKRRIGGEMVRGQ